MFGVSTKIALGGGSSVRHRERELQQHGHGVEVRLEAGWSFPCTRTSFSDPFGGGRMRITINRLRVNMRLWASFISAPDFDFIGVYAK